MAKTIKLYGHNYEIVNPNTQRAKDMFHKFLRSYDSCLDDVYAYHHSRAKDNAYEYCREREREFNSLDGVITSYNTWMFTYAFTGKDEEGKKWLIYIMPNHDYAIDYDAL